MSNFGELILDVLNEKGKTIKDLEENGVLGKNTFYIFSETAPSINSILKIANYLKVSVDYLVGRATENSFKKYKLNQTAFYSKLNEMLKSSNISQVNLCKDLQMSRTNLSRWKNGTKPTLTKFIAVCNYFGCSADDLLEHEDE